MNYNNRGLVVHAKRALADNTRYMWGGIYRRITDAYVDMLAKIYPKQYSKNRRDYLKSLPDSYYGVDCVGLIKSYYWSGNENGGAGSPNYGAKGYPDVNANAMYAAAKVKGKIGTLPEREGVIVYCKSSPHVGVYIGGGCVIESTLGSRGDGVVKTKLSDFKWEYWFECPYISYDEDYTDIADTEMYATTNVNIRSGAGTEYSILGVLYRNTIVTVIGEKDDWSVINYNGKEAYVYSQYLAKIPSAQNEGIRKGSKVVVSKNCKTTYDGGAISSKYVANGVTEFEVLQISGNRVVIGVNGNITAAVDKKYLRKV